MSSNNKSEHKQLVIEVNDELLSNPSFDASDQVLFRQIDSEAVLLHMTNGSYYSLNGTSLPFWEAIRDRAPLAVAVDKIIDEYEVERSQVLVDLKSFLQQMLGYKLITRTGVDAAG